MENGAIFHRLKAAQRDLISRAGGIERAALITSTSTSQMGRFANGNDGALMTLPVVLALESDTGVALVTSVMAQANGRVVQEQQAGQPSPSGLMMSHSDLMRKSAELTQSMAVAISDGMVSPTEAETLDRIAAELFRALEKLRMGLASIKSSGGTKAALTVVEGGVGQ